uniref:Uncharacterized protein n=1 Tax=Romanomermis culicivorax TaxID=13658 RepID=A0A915IDN8_ROMCU
MVTKFQSSKTRQQRLKIIKKYAKAILPHVGLILLSMIYVITGASAFYYLERPHELRIRRTYVRNVTILKVNFLNDVWYSGRGENRLLESKSDELEVYRPSQQLSRPEAENRLERITKKLFEAFDTHYVEAGHLLHDEEAGSDRDRADNRTEADDVVIKLFHSLFNSVLKNMAPEAICYRIASAIRMDAAAARVSFYHTPIIFNI